MLPRFLPSDSYFLVEYHCAILNSCENLRHRTEEFLRMIISFLVVDHGSHGFLNLGG